MEKIEEGNTIHYIKHVETMINPKWIDKFNVGDIVEINYGNGRRDKFKVELVKRLKEI